MQLGVRATDSETVTLQDTAEPTGWAEHDGSPWVFSRGEWVAGRFVVERPIGRGGLGQVFQGFDLVLGHRLALKVLRPDVVGRPEADEMLRREALLAREVTHPNVCRIFDVFEHRIPSADGEAHPPLLVVAMEWVEGPTLGERLSSEGPMSPAAALRLAAQIAAALDAAHAADVLHLDLKSSNVILASQTQGVRAVVTDFGLALERRAAAEGLGQPRGTPGYMAPEQLAGGALSPATDIFAFGCVLAELITGRLPSDAGGVGRRPPRRWRRAIARCLAVEPQQRPRSASEVVASLAPPGRHTLGRALAAVLLILGLLAIGARWDSPPPADATRPMEASSAVITADPWVAALPADRAAREALLQARRALHRHRGSEARELVERALEIAPESSLSHIALADAWALLGYDRREITAAERALELAEGGPKGLWLLAVARERQVRRQWRSAAQGYSALHALFPDHLDYGLALVTCLFGAEDKDGAEEALASLHRTELGPLERARLAHYKARIASASGDRVAQLEASRQALELAREAAARALEARALSWIGMAEVHLGNVDLGLEKIEAALTIFDEIGDERSVMESRQSLAMYRIDVQGYREELAQVFSKAIDFHRRIGHREGEAIALFQAATLALERKETAKARALFERSRRLYHELGAEQNVAMVSTNLALLHQTEGRLGAAEELYRDALEKRRRIGRKSSLATLLNNLGSIYTARGEVRRARDAFLEAGAHAHDVGYLLMEVLAQDNLARLEILEGNPAAAREHLGPVVPRLDEVGVPRVSVFVMLTAGWIDMLEGDPDRAERTFRSARNLAEEVGDPFASARADLRLAALANLRGDFSEAEVRARRTAEVFGRGVDLDAFFEARHELVRALVARGKLEEAGKVVSGAALGPGDESLEHLARARLLGAHYRLGSGRPAAARVLLEDLLAEIPRNWLVPLRAEAAGLLAEIERRSGERPAGRR